VHPMTSPARIVAAGDALRNLYGVTGVTNDITVKSQPQPADVRIRIEKALQRSAELDSDAITVSISDGAVTLDGRGRAHLSPVRYRRQTS
jgi:osmotically-inducible protein OsmY